MPIILPTRGRPFNLKRFIAAYHATDAREDVWVAINKDDHSYEGVALPDNFTVVEVEGTTCLQEAINQAYTLMLPNYENIASVGVIADDCVPISPRWDVILAAIAGNDSLAWGRDDIQNGNLPTHPFIGHRIIERLGWVACPAFRHCFVDNAWKDIFTGLGRAYYCKDVHIKHMHHLTGNATLDATYRGQPDILVDAQRYSGWRDQELPGLVELARGR